MGLHTETHLQGNGSQDLQGNGSNDLQCAGRDGSNMEGNHDSNDEQGLPKDSETHSVTESDQMASVSNYLRKARSFYRPTSQFSRFRDTQLQP